MSKIMIWVGQFDSEADFEKYMDQSAFRLWWKEYDEDNKEIRCQFCKELGVMDYDEDFLIMKYASAGMTDLPNMIPANTEKISKVIAEKGIKKANAVVCYNCREGISPNKAEAVSSMMYLGSFEFELSPNGMSGSTVGLKYMIWIGTTDKNQDEFMEYFNQDEYLKELRAYEDGYTKKRPNPEHRCQFCKDLDIKFYYPEFLRVHFFDNITPPAKMITNLINDPQIPERWIEDDCIEYNITKANCVFCYIPNGFRDKKKDQKIYILKEENKGLLGIPKKHVDALANYNGLIYLSSYKLE